jgi:hypothetical protein
MFKLEDGDQRQGDWSLRTPPRCHDQWRKAGLSQQAAEFFAQGNECVPPYA